MMFKFSFIKWIGKAYVFGRYWTAIYWISVGYEKCLNLKDFETGLRINNNF